MAQFVCRLATPTGAVLDRECEAVDPAALRQQLERDGYYVFGIRPKTAGLRFGPALAWRRRVSRKTLLALTQELLALLDRKSTRLNSSHSRASRMPSSA